MRLKAQSVGLRLTLWHVAVLAMIILGFALGTYLFVRESLLQQIDYHLDRDFATVLRAVTQGPGELEWLTRHGNVALFRVVEDREMVVETEGWRRAQLGQIVTAGSPADYRTSAAPDGQPYRMKVSEVTPGGPPVMIAVAHEESTYRQSMQSLMMILLLGIPAALLLAVGGVLSGWARPFPHRNHGGQGPGDNRRTPFRAPPRRESG